MRFGVLHPELGPHWACWHSRQPCCALCALTAEGKAPRLDLPWRCPHRPPPTSVWWPTAINWLQTGFKLLSSFLKLTRSHNRTLRPPLTLEHLKNLSNREQLSTRHSKVSEISLPSCHGLKLTSGIYFCWWPSMEFPAPEDRNPSANTAKQYKAIRWRSRL